MSTREVLAPLQGATQGDTPRPHPSQVWSVHAGIHHRHRHCCQHIMQLQLQLSCDVLTASVDTAANRQQRVNRGQTILIPNLLAAKNAVTLFRLIVTMAVRGLSLQIVRKSWERGGGELRRRRQRRQRRRRRRSRSRDAAFIYIAPERPAPRLHHWRCCQVPIAWPNHPLHSNMRAVTSVEVWCRAAARAHTVCSTTQTLPLLCVSQTCQGDNSGSGLIGRLANRSI